MKSIFQQLKTTAIPGNLLEPHSRAFNAGLIYHLGRNLMAYRVAPKGEKWCVIRMLELSSEWKVITDKAVNIPCEGNNLEDPRLFAGPDDSLFMAWTDATYTEGTGWTCVQKFGPIEEAEDGSWHCPKAFQPRYGKNDGSGKEKNWQFFFQDERLFCIYQHSPQIVLEIEGDEVIEEYKSDGFRWKWGHPSGGTPPIEYGDKLLSFFHAYTPEDMHARRYNFGAVVMEKTAPFKAVFVSPEPIVTASERDELAPDPQWHPLCIFPGGAILNKEGIHIASGVNDCALVVQSLPVEKLLTVPVAPKVKGEFVMVKLLTSMILSGGHFGQRGDEIELSRREAIDFIARGRAEILPDEFFPAPSIEEQEEALIEERPKKKKRQRHGSRF